MHGKNKYEAVSFQPIYNRIFKIICPRWKEFIVVEGIKYFSIILYKTNDGVCFWDDEKKEFCPDNRNVQEYLVIVKDQYPALKRICLKNGDKNISSIKF